MPRRNLSGTCWGVSERLTVRISPKELRAVNELVAAWGEDRSEAIRRAIRQAATQLRQRGRQARLDALPDLTVARLRRLATELGIPGRSRMTSAELRSAVRTVLQR